MKTRLISIIMMTLRLGPKAIDYARRGVRKAQDYIAGAWAAYDCDSAWTAERKTQARDILSQIHAFSDHGATLVGCDTMTFALIGMAILRADDEHAASDANILRWSSLMEPLLARLSGDIVSSVALLGEDIQLTLE